MHLPPFWGRERSSFRAFRDQPGPRSPVAEIWASFSHSFLAIPISEASARGSERLNPLALPFDTSDCKVYP